MNTPNIKVDTPKIKRTTGIISDAAMDGGSGPALYFKIKNSAGAVGFIAGSSTTFCETCNRIRLTSDGKIKPCLYAAQDYDIRQLMREGASDEHVRGILQKIIAKVCTG